MDHSQIITMDRGVIFMWKTYMIGHIQPKPRRVGPK